MRVPLPWLVASACLFLAVLSPACDSSKPKFPPTITIEEAMRAVQQVPGAKAFALGVESPDSVYQDVADAAQVQMLLNGESLRMSFKRRNGQWEWTAGASPKWPGLAKSPTEVVAWVAAQKH